MNLKIYQLLYVLSYRNVIYAIFSWNARLVLHLKSSRKITYEIMLIANPLVLAISAIKAIKVTLPFMTVFNIKWTKQLKSFFALFYFCFYFVFMSNEFLYFQKILFCEKQNSRIFFGFFREKRSNFQFYFREKFTKIYYHTNPRLHRRNWFLLWRFSETQTEQRRIKNVSEYCYYSTRFLPKNIFTCKLYSV
jgi:hypothetical protein